MRIRNTKTKSGSTAIQVVRSEQGKTIILKHLASGKTPEEISHLREAAVTFLAQYSQQQSFFREESSFDPLFKNYRYLGTRSIFLYKTLFQVFVHMGFSDLKDQLLLDLALIRLVEPSSKRESVKQLSCLFGINYDLTQLYKHLKIVADKKEQVEKILVDFAKNHLNFDFSFVLYDVPTLYFESFTADDLRKCGFSKDNKFNQPQIVVGLLVNRDGFPLSFDVFSGDKFEGLTIIPIITSLVSRYQIKNLTVVADAAMLSEKNIENIILAGLNYIVGARLGYLSDKEAERICQKLNHTDSASIRLLRKDKTLICDFSSKRYLKDKNDTEKQIQKAKDVLEGKAVPKRYRFLTGGKNNFFLNENLIDQSKLLWGIKGYCTNLDLPNSVIIDRYHDLWQVEKSFRMTKSDLLTRPIFHFKEKAIKAHLLICVMALSVGKYLEIKSKKSLQTVLDELKKITDARVVNIITGEETGWRAEISDEVKKILSDLEVAY